MDSYEQGTSLTYTKFLSISSMIHIEIISTKFSFCFGRTLVVIISNSPIHQC